MFETLPSRKDRLPGDIPDVTGARRKLCEALAGCKSVDTSEISPSLPTKWFKYAYTYRNCHGSLVDSHTNQLEEVERLAAHTASNAADLKETHCRQGSFGAADLRSHLPDPDRWKPLFSFSRFTDLQLHGAPLATGQRMSIGKMSLRPCPLPGNMISRCS